MQTQADLRKPNAAMLQNPLSWNPNASEIIYTSASEKKRTIYLYDVYNEVSKPIKFPENEWFEFQFIHDEQFVLHSWKNGIYLHDIPTKKSQRLAAAPLSRFFNFDTDHKKMLFNSEGKAYLYDPKTQKSQMLLENANEVLIDPVHKTFITITDEHEPSLNIYYKNEIIFEQKGAFNIHARNDFSKLIYFSEDSETEKSQCHILDLNELKIIHSEAILGLIQNANLVGGVLHINALRGKNYGLYLFDLSSLRLKALKRIEHDDQIFTALSPDCETIAILRDFETSTKIELFELDNES